MSEFWNRGASLLIDGQFGSTGKGLFAAYVSLKQKFDIATTNASANAGHTTIIGDRKFVTYHLPTVACMQPDCIAYLNAGAIIDPDVLMKEIAEHPGIETRLFIHPHAAVIYDRHREAERAASEGTTQTGSTQKGCGAALADKLMRRGNIAANDPKLAPFVNKIDLAASISHGTKVIIEVPQGFSLSLNSGFYPHVTSREVSVSQALSDAGLHPEDLGVVMVTLRTYPIRVGNIQDAEGETIGYSGDGYHDQKQIDWSVAGVEPEVTTVTKRQRRLFSWSRLQTAHAMDTLRPDIVFLNFVNYLTTKKELMERMEDVEEAGSWNGLVTHFGFGPDVADIVDDVDVALERLN